MSPGTTPLAAGSGWGLCMASASAGEILDGSPDEDRRGAPRSPSSATPSGARVS